MLLKKKSSKNTAYALYNDIIKYSRSKSYYYQSVSPLDIKNADEKVLRVLKDRPEIAQEKCKNDVPFILICVECGLIESVNWFLKTSKCVDLTDRQLKNIATYAYELNLTDVLEACKKVAPQLLDAKDENGISVAIRLENDKKIKELARKK